MALGNFKTMKFTTKLFTAVILLCIVSILITSGNAIRMTDNGLQALGEKGIENMHRTVFDSLILYDANIRKKLDSDMKLLEQEIHGKGELTLDADSTVQTNLVHQITKQSEQKNIPKMKAGEGYINGSNSAVDAIEAAVGSSATVFQLVDDKLLRIATTVKNPGGERAIGTYIPADSPVYKTVLKGEVFRGKAYVVNDWYLTAYAPLRSAQGKIIGALYVGQPMINPSITDFILKSKFGAGYCYIYTENGEILVHPTLQAKTDLFELVPALKGFKDGLIHYELKGEERISFVKYLEPWGIYVNISVTRSDIIGGLDVMMLRHNLLVGLFVLAGAVLITLLLVRTINSPLKELAEKSVKVGEGDYTIGFQSQTDDAIGRLTNALGMMVAKAKEMLEDIVQSSKALTAASAELAAISQQMVGNADATTEIAEASSRHAGEVADNMHSVSAAMEQSTTNLDMIASASEEMGATIKEIAENSARARLTTEEAVAKAKKSHEGVQELGEAARAIGTVTETITEISEQTNLLALNATIEAARAGDAGKGFAVVANEIKELARQTAGATRKIKQAISEIQNQTGITVKDIESITTVIQDVNEVVNSIVTAVEEQSITTSEIVNNVTQASRGITEINQNVASSSEMTAMMTAGVGQVKERSLEVKASSQQVRSSADELSKLAKKLTGLVSKFTI